MLWRIFIGVAVLALPTSLWSTSTSGATTRNVLIDGVVTTGAVNGTNGVDWELDEVFDGFSNIVNWYVTWDDQNLYLGRIGGNNTEGSVLYVRAEYPGSQTVNRGFNYDNLEPEVSLMGGINFAAYMKDTYSEFRTYAGGVWGAANTSLTPAFSMQGPNAHMEVAIPWNAISNNNGKPFNIRIVLYQIVPLANPPACSPAQHFVYGESPWGTGLPGDGPSVGVNDGVGVSARQPGGCGVGADTATRWWGCYPVIGGVGSNGWTAVPPAAGSDTSICESATSFFLQGNSPPAEAVGTWTLVSQPFGAAASIQNVNTPNSLFSGMTALGDYVLTWDINYGGCPAVADTVVISRVAAPPAAFAGADITVGCDVSNTILQGNGPGSFTGTWSLASGLGVIVSPNSPTTTVTSLAAGENVFYWTIEGGVCPDTRDSVSVFAFASISADAGIDQELCQASITTMTAADPALLQPTAIGQWQQFAGPSSVVFTNNLDPISNVSGLTSGSYIFVWTVTNGNCPAATDTMTILVNAAPNADAGPDRSYCSQFSVPMDGNDPASFGANGFGYWVQLAGPSTAVFADSTLYNTFVSGLVNGTYRFAWYVGNGNCPVSNDVVTVVITSLQDMGVDTLINPHQGQFDGSATINEPLNGSPPYLYALDAGAYQSDPTFSNLGPGTYTVTILDGNGCSDTLTFFLSELINPPPVPNDTLFIPDGFSPNADGVNDTWEIIGIGNYPEAVIEIYNIWGALIYKSEGAYNPWNGTYQAKEMPQATYYYIVDLGGDRTVYRGSVTLFR